MLDEGTLVDGKYKILSEIGRGGMSVVYLAINEKANKTWAIKEVRKDGKNDYNMVRQGLITEIETLKAVKHPKLPSIIDVIDDDDSFIIVMDYVEGRSLDKILKDSGPQPEEYVIEWAKQLCDVLGYLHSRPTPIIYRDMKPSNIMLKPNGDITIIDFGTAKRYEVEVGATTGLGTAGYAAPEQYVNSGLGRTDARTDIYALGMTLYYILTGVDPQKTFVTDTSIRLINPSFSRGLDKIIVKCTQQNPDERYQSCAEVMYDLEHVSELDEPFRKKQRVKFGTFAAACVLSVVFLGCGIIFNVIADEKATDNYKVLIDEASITAEYSTKIELYEESIAVPNKSGEKDAYLGLIQAYKENDSKFSVEEAKQLEKLIKQNKEELQKNTEGYVEVCFETGKLFWYYYDYGYGSDNQMTRAKSSVEWFQEVIENASSDYENIGMAKAYASIGMFYRDITTNITEASDKGEYRPLFENLCELIDTVAASEDESEIVRLELIEMCRNAVRQYATKFKTDGVSEDELLDFFDELYRIFVSVDVPDDPEDVRTIKKVNTQEQMADTRQAIETAYGTNKGEE